MHKSGLVGFIIDCNTEDLDAAAQFWSEALRLPLEEGGGDPGYRKLAKGPGGLNIEVQQVDHPSRVHLDIESTDVEAEVQRLERLGAKPVSQVRDWVVMEAPTGQRFCVVPARGD
ncbi:VOC family protein [Dongia deserti]|uniref:VOC family protein n=1 Tax=Dongia deserti TaxID=2268030 RepID=UPI000E65E86B|nr:VOC family protein [Dongia deserti]